MPNTFYLQDGTRIDALQPATQTIRLTQADRVIDPDTGQYTKFVRDVQVAKWETTDQRVLNVEIRAWVSGIAKPDTGHALSDYHARDPRITYWLATGFGGAPVTTPDTRGTTYASSAAELPGRGLATRVAGRNVELHLRYDGCYPSKLASPDANPDHRWVDVQVLFLPVDSLGLAAPPSAAVVRDGGSPFPPEATEFKLVQDCGLPWPPGIVDISFRTTFGMLQDVDNNQRMFDRSDFADWTPIAPRMLAWHVEDYITPGTESYYPGFVPVGSAPADAKAAANNSQGCFALYR